MVRAIYDAYRKGSSMGAITRALRAMMTALFPTCRPPRHRRSSWLVSVARPHPTRNGHSQPRKASLGTRSTPGTPITLPVDSRGKCRSYNSTWRDYIVRDENGEIVKGTTWEPIVAEDVWWECQERRDSNLEPRRRHSHREEGQSEEAYRRGRLPLRDLRRQGEERGDRQESGLHPHPHL